MLRFVHEHEHEHNHIGVDARQPRAIQLALALALVLGACESDPSHESEARGDKKPAPSADAALADAGADDAGPRDASLPAPDVLPDAADPMLPDLGPRPTLEVCFPGFGGALSPNYEQFDPTIGRHCFGTDHQDIQGIERLVFLGDSVTRGTPPTRSEDFYRTLVTEAVIERFGEVDVEDCSAFGARTDDLLIGKEQIPQCFPESGDERTTLVIFTVGGNDIFKWAERIDTVEEAIEAADDAAQLLRESIEWLKDPERFPNGIYIIYANPYEYTDGTGELNSCALAEAAGLSGNWLIGAPAVLRFQEHFMSIATDHRVDMIFTLEHFCGHGYRREYPDGICYRGPDAELWFDLTCIHPNPVGHAKIAEMFMAVVDE